MITLRALAHAVTVGLFVASAAGCAADTSEDDGADDEASADLAVDHLDTHYGAAGVIFSGASLEIWNKLHAAGVTHIRQAAYLSYARFQTSVPADVKAVQAIPGADLFIMVQLAHCTSQPAAGCGDLGNPDVSAAAIGFRAHFQAVVEAANPGGVINVKTFGINEPDLDLASLKDSPERAAHFYWQAREVLDETGCGGCKLVAGELAYGDKAWTARYVDELKKLNMSPSTFSMHPYGDVNEATPTNYKTVKATRTDGFMEAVRVKFPHATFWLTETGRELPKVHGTASDEWAAGMFVRTRLARTKGVSRVYWWDMAGDTAGLGGSCGWDSALGDHEGNARASFYGFLGYDLKTALEKSHAAKTQACK